MRYVYISNTTWGWLLCQAIIYTLSCNERKRVLFMVSQHWFRKWLGASVDQYLGRHMAPLGQNELNKCVKWMNHIIAMDGVYNKLFDTTPMDQWVDVHGPLPVGRCTAVHNTTASPNEPNKEGLIKWQLERESLPKAPSNEIVGDRRSLGVSRAIIENLYAHTEHNRRRERLVTWINDDYHMRNTDYVSTSTIGQTWHKPTESVAICYLNYYHPYVLKEVLSVNLNTTYCAHRWCNDLKSCRWSPVHLIFIINLSRNQSPVSIKIRKVIIPWYQSHQGEFSLL